MKMKPKKKPKKKQLTQFIFVLSVITASVASSFYSSVCSAQGFDMENQKKFTLTGAYDVQPETPAGLLELSISIPKQGDFVYIPFISIFLQHSRIKIKDVIESTSESRINGSVIGFKLGVMLPTLIFNVPFYFYGDIGISRMTVQSDPWLGKPEKGIGRSRLHQIDMGVKASISDFIFGINFSKSDVAYMGDHQMLFLGYNF